jgi:hypothetical protein
MPDDAASLLGYMVRDGIGGTEMHSEPIEEWAGAPKNPAMHRNAGRPVVGPQLGQARRPAGSAAQSPEQEAYTKAISLWRLSTSLSKFEKFRTWYAKAGVSIYAFKLQLTNAMSDELFDWAFEATKAVGATHLTMEMPDGDSALTARIGEFAMKHKTRVGYHAHLQATPTTWDEAMKQSPYNCINLDIGHYTAAGNHDVLDFIKQHHQRITSVHLKDRQSKEHGGQNMPWGQGDTPIVQVLQMMKTEKYKFPATIELEYAPPEGSDSEREVIKCLAYAKAALS